MSRIDYTGMTIGRLTFLSADSEKVNGIIIWNTKCQCGNEQKFRAAYISMMKHRGSTFECSKCKCERKSPTLTDKVYGRLTVLEEVPKKGKNRTWLVRCECGVEKEIISSRLLSKKHPTRSCGCLARKLQSKWVNTTQYPPAHQLRTKNTEEINASLYHARNAFVAACYREDDSRYKNYGALGHTVCDLWRNGAKDFVKWALKNNYQKGYGIYLKEGKTEFSPNNCYIQCKGEYAKLNNSKNIKFNGRSQSITDWANELGCSISCLSQRLRKYSDYPLEKIMDITWIPDREKFYGTEHYENSIIELYQKGKSFKNICNELRCSSSTISRFLKKNQLNPRPQFATSAIQFKEKIPLINSLVKEGKTFVEISKALDIKYDSMMYHYKNYLKKLSSPS